MNSDPPSTWTPWTGGSGGDELGEQRFGGVGRGFGCDVADRPFGDGVVSGEVFDRLVGAEIDEERVDLDEFAGRGGFSALGQALGVALALVQAEAPAAGPAAQPGRGNDDAAVHQPFEDPPDLGDADSRPLAFEDRRDFALAPHRIVGADGLDRLHESGWPLGLSDALGPARARLGRFLPAVERRTGRAHGGRRLLGGEAVRHGPPPAADRIASSLRFDIRGLRCEKTRRCGGLPDNLPRQATNLHGGLLRLVDSQLSASETPFPFSILPSRMCPNPDMHGVSPSKDMVSRTGPVTGETARWKTASKSLCPRA